MRVFMILLRHYCARKRGVDVAVCRQIRDIFAFSDTAVAAAHDTMLYMLTRCAA